MTDHKTVREALEQKRKDANQMIVNHKAMNIRADYWEGVNNALSEALAALDRIEAVETVTGMSETLPCDVTIGVATFRRGVPTRLVLEKIKWWQGMKEKGMDAPQNRCHRQKPDPIFCCDDTPINQVYEG